MGGLHRNAGRVVPRESPGPFYRSNSCNGPVLHPWSFPLVSASPATFVDVAFLATGLVFFRLSTWEVRWHEMYV